MKTLPQKISKEQLKKWKGLNDAVNHYKKLSTGAIACLNEQDYKDYLELE